MENKAFVDLKEYDELRKFKENMLKEMVCVEERWWDELERLSMVEAKYYSKDDILKKVIDRHKDKEMELLRKIDNLNNKLDEIYKMNCAKFRKWKRNWLFNMDK